MNDVCRLNVSDEFVLCFSPARQAAPPAFASVVTQDLFMCGRRLRGQRTPESHFADELNGMLEVNLNESHKHALLMPIGFADPSVDLPVPSFFSFLRGHLQAGKGRFSTLESTSKLVHQPVRRLFVQRLQDLAVLPVGCPFKERGGLFLPAFKAHVRIPVSTRVDLHDRTPVKNPSPLPNVSAHCPYLQTSLCSHTVHCITWSTWWPDPG